jgi:phosphate uptake regulator
VRVTFAQQVARIERRMEDEIERAAVTLADIAQGIQIPTAENAAEIAEAGRRLHQASRSVDAELMVVTARQGPVAGDLRLLVATSTVTSSRPRSRWRIRQSGASWR